MKHLAFLVLVLAQTLFIQAAFAEETPSASTEIPIAEQDFVKNINKFTKEQIIAQFGEPAKADDVKVKGTGKIVASIWMYHYINTAADGTYYETTELDFIDDKVVMVAFLNNDGAEGPDQGQQYEVPIK
ncbi:MAG: hypothetical protein B7Y16_05190 [Methylotenera sp. 24-45-7]|jgi:hypothetical protein|nr:MAG: hypothetical protein B7Y16_05190 [Methylotenera sp. 24-45-7]OZA09085.1 MAG: hypothetical protein B7X97_03940 [Methylotenera sp. 17-45-7]OZA54074.1 MAG: hypothetical protein B7X73_02200 [Methylophilales bacterium 39-45-7]HQS37233.1 hypothetical protein [Methylotenera sp.]HQS42884.1 hypothetical protein [Methylotenera sp.]